MNTALCIMNQVGKIALAIGFLMTTLELYNLKKRLIRQEEYYPKHKCPYQNPNYIHTDSPCMRKCPVHNGICYRWNLCYLGIRAKENEKKECEG